MTVTYSPAVKDQIRIRRGDLVAVDLAPAVPEVVWRWWWAEVLEPLGPRPATGCIVADVHGTIAEATLARPELVPAPGDRVWIRKTESGVEVIDRAAGGEPEAAEWVRQEWFPRIEAAYAAKVNAE